jgi:hypothetical protein
MAASGKPFRYVPENAHRILEELPALFSAREFFGAGERLGLDEKEISTSLGALFISGQIARQEGGWTRVLMDGVSGPLSPERDRPPAPGLTK